MSGRRKSFRCDWLDWHRPGETASFDGCSYHAACQRCGRDIMQDSQGNWFAASPAGARRRIAHRAYIDVLSIVEATGPLSDRVKAEEDCVRAVLRAFDEMEAI